jgi:hypothetical protein
MYEKEHDDDDSTITMFIGNLKVAVAGIYIFTFTV